MPLPFDMLAVMLFIGYYTGTPDAAPPLLAYSLAVMLAAIGLTAAVAAAVNHIALHKVRAKPSPAGRRAIAVNADIFLRSFLALLFAAALTESALPWRLAAMTGIRPSPESFALQALGVAAYVVMFFAAWFPMYPLHRETTAGVWTRRSFLIQKARYNLYMLLAWLPFAFLADWLGEYLGVLPVLFLAAAWVFPLVLARAWGCTALTDGSVLDCVRRLQQDAGTRFSRVYLWEPGGGNTQNAAAVGFLPPFRYLFLTPALVRGMREDELAAVILHELGHVKKAHLLFYLVTSLAAINISVLAGLFLASGRTAQFIITVVLILFHFRFVFGWLSRAMERQADLFASEKAHGPRNLANALEKLALSAGRIRLAASWHHLGVAERVDYLRHAGRDPALPRIHHARVAVMMVGGYLLAALSIGLMVALLYPSADGAPAIQAENAGVRHWRRVVRLLPGKPEAELELAHSLAGRPDGRREAVRHAEQAAAGGQGEVKEAAARLLEDLRE